MLDPARLVFIDEIAASTNIQREFPGYAGVAVTV
jgi:hypothetical protein